MTAARDFTRMQFDWLRQVQDDPAISHAAFMLAFIICDHINAQSLRAWPTQETLANAVRVNVRTVRRLADELRAAGHLTVIAQRRRHDPNVYQLARLDRTPMSALKAVRPDTHVRSQTVKTGHSEHLDRTFSTVRPDTHALQNTPRNTLKEHSSDQGREAGASSPLDEDAKAILFSEGLNWLATTTGKSPSSLRSAIGVMLKVARDDAGHVLAIIRKARQENRADPVAWTLGVLRSRQGGSPVQANGAKAPAAIPVGMQLSKPAARA